MSTPENANEGCVGPESEQAGKASACDGCPNQAACASGATRAAMNAGPTEEELLIKERLKGVKHIVMVLSGKGGVGKSTVSSQLAFTLAAAGKSVGLLDIDITGPSIPRMLGLLGQKVHQSSAGWSPVWVDENLGVMSIQFMLPSEDDAIIWRGPRKNGLIKQFLSDVEWGNIDYLIIDTPPGTSDEHISIAQMLKAYDGGSLGAVVVTTPQKVAMSDVRKELNFCKKVGLKVHSLVENMSGFLCPCCGTKSEIFPAPKGAAGSAAAGPKAMAEEFGVPYGGAIPIDPTLLEACEEGKCYASAYPEARGREAFLAVVREVVAEVEGEAEGKKFRLPGDESGTAGNGAAMDADSSAAAGNGHGGGST
jgi:Mrp family chromosome partitioning ATPase